MVGHTGVIPAAIKAIETVDECVGKAVEAVKEVDGQMFICADHGNAEQMIDYTTGEPLYCSYDQSGSVHPGKCRSGCTSCREGGRLADIIPTLIELMGHGAAKRDDRRKPACKIAM